MQQREIQTTELIVEKEKELLKIRMGSISLQLSYSTKSG